MAVGAGDGRIIFRHILPNVLSHVIVAVTLQIPAIVLLESFLGFLGFAVKPPLISWGLMLQDTGSFSVIEGQAFAGEGLVDSLKAGERRLLSYAVDLGIQMDAKGDAVPTKVTKVQFSRGAVIQTTEERQRRTYSARNEDTEPRTLIIEPSGPR